MGADLDVTAYEIELIFGDSPLITPQLIRHQNPDHLVTRYVSRLIFVHRRPDILELPCRDFFHHLVVSFVLLDVQTVHFDEKYEYRFSVKEQHNLIGLSLVKLSMLMEKV